MANKIIDVVASKYSDGGASKGAPPTPADVKMRIKHTSDSVPYNLNDHAYDHIKEGIVQLEKLCEYDPKKCQTLAKSAINKLQPLIDEIKEHADGKKH